MKKTIKPSHADIIKYIESNGYGGESIQSDGNPTHEAYEDAMQELMSQTEHKLVNSEREAESAMILFACILGGIILILLAIAMG